MSRCFKIVVALLLLPLLSAAKLNILTTTTNLKSLVETIGGDRVQVHSFSKGTQDPHYIEAKPSYMLKAAKADLLISIGLELEVGWLPLILRGSRNPKIRPGHLGSFIAGEHIQTLEKPKGAISRAQGDVHPEGNPHILLDPLNALAVAKALKEKLAQIDAKNAAFYEKNLVQLTQELKEKMKEWKKRVQVGLKVITYHKTLTYFFHRFGVKNVSMLEPKPGVPPTARHILSVMRVAKKEGVQRALVENFFDSTVARRVAKEVPGLEVITVPVAVEGEPGIDHLFALYERLVRSVESQ